jgi:hypothetical protein
MSKPRVFVSSIVKDFSAYRSAASRGIERASAEPVLVNEDLAADARSSRSTCLDAVASCDAMVLIIATRGGWTTPSGKLVIEEEYEEAVRRCLPVYVFLQTGTADTESQRFGARVSDYVEGRFRHEFSTPEELEQLVFSAVRGLSSTISMPETSPKALDARLRELSHLQNEPVLRVVIAPERQEELISPIELSGGALEKLLYRLGHDGETPLFDYSHPKSSRTERDAIIIEQTDSDARHGETRRVWLALDERGVLVVEANVAGRRRAAGDRDRKSVV